MTLPKHNDNFSYSDYLTWSEEERIEIIDGALYLKAAPSRIHQEISGALYLQFANYLKNKQCKVYHAPFCVMLDNETNDYNIKNIVEPDITIVCDNSKLNDRGCKGSPDLIIEVLSPSTAKIDRIHKFNKYEKSQIREYWIVEPEQKIISVFILQSNNRYGRPDMYTEQDNIKVSIFSDLIIDLNEVF